MAIFCVLLIHINTFSFLTLVTSFVCITIKFTLSLHLVESQSLLIKLLSEWAESQSLPKEHQPVEARLLSELDNDPSTGKIVVM